MKKPAMLMIAVLMLGSCDLFTDPYAKLQGSRLVTEKAAGLGDDYRIVFTAGKKIEFHHKNTVSGEFLFCRGSLNSVGRAAFTAACVTWKGSHKVGDTMDMKYALEWSDTVMKLSWINDTGYKYTLKKE